MCIPNLAIYSYVYECMYTHGDLLDINMLGNQKRLHIIQVNHAIGCNTKINNYCIEWSGVQLDSILYIIY